MATATLQHGYDPNLVGAHLGRDATWITRESDYLFDLDCDQAALDAAIAGAMTGLSPITVIQAQVGAAIQAMIDGVCTSGVPYFRDIFSARGYVGDPNPAYHARAVALRDWSSSVWTALDEIQADVMAGNRPLPTIAELMGELPGAPQ
jgi:hypothetical protein